MGIANDLKKSLKDLDLYVNFIYIEGWKTIWKCDLRTSTSFRRVYYEF